MKTIKKELPTGIITTQKDIIAINNTAYINIVSVTDTTKLSKDVIKYKKMLPADAIICTGKSTGGDLKYAEVFALKNNDNKINTETTNWVITKTDLNTPPLTPSFNLPFNTAAGLNEARKNAG